VSGEISLCTLAGGKHYDLIHTEATTELVQTLQAKEKKTSIPLFSYFLKKETLVLMFCTVIRVPKRNLYKCTIEAHLMSGGGKCSYYQARMHPEFFSGTTTFKLFLLLLALLARTYASCTIFSEQPKTNSFHRFPPTPGHAMDQ
jgi:hypothetical protein